MPIGTRSTPMFVEWDGRPRMLRPCRRSSLEDFSLKIGSGWCCRKRGVSELFSSSRSNDFSPMNGAMRRDKSEVAAKFLFRWVQSKPNIVLHANQLLRLTKSLNGGGP